MKTSWFQAATVAGFLVASNAAAQDTSDAAHKAMHDAMNDHAAMPAKPAAMPDQAMKPGMGHDQMRGATDSAGQAIQHGAMYQGAKDGAMHQGAKDGAAAHAAAANRAGMNAATNGAMPGSHGDMHDAANKERMKEMHGGMMGSGTTGGMMTSGTGTTGGMTPGAGTTSGTTTTPPPATTGGMHK